MFLSFGFCLLSSIYFCPLITTLHMHLTGNIFRMHSQEKFWMKYVLSSYCFVHTELVHILLFLEKNPKTRKNGVTARGIFFLSLIPIWDKNKKIFCLLSPTLFGWLLLAHHMLELFYTRFFVCHGTGRPNQDQALLLNLLGGYPIGLGIFISILYQKMALLTTRALNEWCNA